MEMLEIERLPEREIFPGFRGRFVHASTVTLAHWTARAGSTVHEHAHPHEQVVHLLDGDFELTVDGVPHRMKPGSVIVVPSNVRHSARAITDCRLIDTFHPVREDYR